jgi:beta-phosphoglucomutase-like phosphatase (HAD superfamily)
VACSSSLDRIRVSLESTDLLRFFEPYLFSASDSPKGKPAPDFCLRAADMMGVDPRACIVVEDSAVGVAAGITVVGFVGGSHAVITDMRALKTAIVDLRGW